MNSLARTILGATMSFPAAVSAGHASWDPWKPTANTPQGGEIRIGEETNVLKLTGMLAIRGYQVFSSPMSRSVCRFSPSCSRYTLEAFSLAGPVNGAIMGVERITRCHACAHPGFYPENQTGGLIKDPARGKPVPLPLIQWFGF